MPVASVHSFVNHKGGVGKTTLTYQLSASYATAHPDCKVLIVDTTDIGDVSELLMGGVYQKTPRDTLRSLVPIANITKLFLHSLSAAMHKTFRVSHGDVNDTDQSVVEDVIEHMPRKSAEAAFDIKERKDSPSLISIEEYAIPLAYVNSGLPTNMYLCPSGLDIEHPLAFSDTQSHNIVDVLLDSFRHSESNWKIFLDTDAAAGGGHAVDVYTQIALAISDFVCIPLHADITDWYRVRSTLNDLHQLRAEKKSHAQVQLVLWNGLSVQSKHEYRMGASVMCRSFTPTKAEQDILTCLNNLVLQEAQHFPDMFLHYKGAKTSSEKFEKECCLCIRNFGAVGVASKDIGVPIAKLHAGLVHGMHTTFNLTDNTISHCRENLEEVVRAVEACNKLVGRDGRKFENGKEVTSSARSAKKPGRKKPKITIPTAVDAVKYKTYSLRNKYPFRHRRKDARSYSHQSPSGTSSTTLAI